MYGGVPPLGFKVMEPTVEHPGLTMTSLRMSGSGSMIEKKMVSLQPSMSMTR